MDETKYEAMSDDNILFYLPHAKILKYNELAKYKTIEKLLPKHKAFSFFCILLQVIVVVIGYV